MQDKTKVIIAGLKQIVQEGDIVNFYGTFPIFAPAIRIITRSPYEAHSGIITDVSNGDIMCTEALFKVETHPLSEAIEKGIPFNIYRVKDLLFEERAEAARQARCLSSKPYAWKQIAGYYYGLITNPSTQNPYLEFNEDGQIKNIYCSQLVVWSYFKASKKMNFEPIVWRKNIHWSMCSPADIGWYSDAVELKYSFKKI